MEAPIIFSKLFLKNSKNELTNQLTDVSVIPIFFSYLNQPKTSAKSKIEMLNLLRNKLKSCRMLFSYFSESDGISFYIYLIDTFLSSDSNEDLQRTILLLIQDLRNAIQLTKAVLDYMYQQFAYLYRNPNELTTKKINMLLILLNALLGDTDSSEKPNNYFCLNGKGGINVDLLGVPPIYVKYPTSILLNFKICMPDLDQSLVIDSGYVANIIEINFSNGKQFSVDLQYPVFITVKNLRKNPIKCLPSDEWLAFVLNIHYRDNKFFFQILINGENNSMSLEVPNFNLDENTSIESITMFKGFFGEATSMALINSKYNNDYKKLTILKSSYLQQFKNLKEGLWKKSIIDSFTNSLFSLDCDDDVQQLPKRSIYAKRKEEPPRKLAEDVRFLFTPLYTNGFHVDDVFGHCQAIMTDGVRIHKFKALQKRLSIIGGGIVNLLPIAEMLYLNQKILTEDILFNYLTVINTILNDRKKNMRNAKSTRFFETLSLFIEKLPAKLFTEKILEALVNIGRSTFRETEEMLASVYFENIFLNEKILSKFSQEIQIKFWNTIALFCQSDKSQIGTFVNMKKICLILQSYDEKKYYQMCCEDHYKQFDPDIVGKIDLMQPSMNRKLSDLKGIISLIIDSQLAENAVILFKLLTLDVSPCLAKFIINIFKGVFMKIQDDAWLKALWKAFFAEKCEIILANTFKHGLLDIRLDIIDFLQEMHKFCKLNLDAPARTNLVKVINMIKSSLVPQNYFCVQDKKYVTKGNEIKELALHCAQTIRNEQRHSSCSSFKGNTSIFKKEKYQEYVTELYKKILMWSIKENKPKIQNNNETENKLNKQNSKLNEQNNKNNETEEQSKIKFEDIKLEQKIITDFDVLIMILSLTDNLNDPLSYKKCIDYLQKFVENKQNCLSIIKSPIVFCWIIQLAFNNFQGHDTYSYNIYGVAYPTIINIIFNIFELVIQTKTAAVTYLPMTSIDIFFTWANKIRNASNENKIHDFLKTIFKGIIDRYNKMTKIEFKVGGNDKKPPTEFELDFYKKNYLILITSIYYFNFYFKFDPAIKTQRIDLLTIPGYDTMKLPEPLLNSISLDMNATKKIEKMWTDYDFFADLLSKIRSLWDKENTYKKADYVKSIVIKYDKLMKANILDKNKKNLYLDDLKLLCYGKTAKVLEIIVPLIRIIPITLAIIINTIRTHTQDQFQARYWIKELRHFIRFIILGSTNATIISQHDKYHSLQSQCLDAIVFGICFLREELNKPNLVGYEYIEKAFEHLLTFCFLIVQEQYRYLEKHKSILKKLGKPARNDLSHCAVFKLFTDFIVDNKQGQPVLTNPTLVKNYSCQFKGLFNEVKTTPEWKTAFFENQTLQARMNTNFLSTCNYQAIVTNRILTEPNLDNKIDDNYQKEILQLVHAYDTELTQYTNNSFYSVRNKKTRYKKIKKSLFTWSGTWSDRDLFYKDISKLKVRILNHYTKYFSKPYLVPILDLDYYIPAFTKFNVNTLFRDKYEQFKLGLDIDAILKSQTNIQDKSNEFITKTNNVNFIRQVYKNSNPELSYSYLKINNKMDLNKDAEIIRSLTTKPATSKMTIISNNNQPKRYLCCLVKNSHHIKGVLSVEQHYIKFQVFLNQKAGNSLSGVDIGFKQTDEDYDSERKTCFGSYFVWHHKDLDKNAFAIEFKQINLFFRKRYYYKNSAIEIFTKYNKSYYFNFKEEKNREKVITEILAHLKEPSKLIDDLREPKTLFDNVVGYQTQTSIKKKVKKQKLSKIISSWCNWEISNYELIMWLNFFANRSYLDLTQYPVMPWVLEDYTDPLQKETEEELPDYKYRDLSLPMGMLTVFPESEVRKEMFIELYDTMKAEQTPGEEPEMKPYVYGSHYSNPVYVANYLTRLFPFSHIAIELQGANFDKPDRLFCSVQTSFFNSATQKTDLRELIPEFYYLPEMFRNLNNLNMGIKENNELVDNVLTPCNNEPFEFVTTLRKVLESTKVSSNIHKWIDLIFGYKQRGKEADAAYNVFTDKSYEDLVDTRKEPDKACLYRLVEFGLTPEQVTAKEFPSRIKKDNVKKLKLVTDSEASLNIWKCMSKFDKKGENCFVVKAQFMDNERINLFFNNNYFTQIKVSYSYLEKEYRAEPTKSNYQFKNKILYKIDECYQGGISRQPPIVFFNQGKHVMLGGFSDGRFVMLPIDNALSSEKTNPLDTNAITAIEIDKDEEYLFCGNSNGNIYVYNILNSSDDAPEKEIFDFKDAITSINVNNELNLWAACSKDGYVNLYTMPTCKLIRSLKLPEKVSPHFIFLSSCPLPCLVVICEMEMFVYTVNGHLHFTQQTSSVIISPIIMRDLHFCEYLAYLMDDTVYIRSFPSLTLEVTVSLPVSVSHLCVSEDNTMLYAVSLDGTQILVIREHKDLKTMDENEMMSQSSII